MFLIYSKFLCFLKLSTCSTFTSDGSSRFFQNPGTSRCQRLISHLLSAVSRFSRKFPVSSGPTGDLILSDFPFMIQQLHTSVYMYNYKLINCCYFFLYLKWTIDAWADENSDKRRRKLEGGSLRLQISL